MVSSLFNQTCVDTNTLAVEQDHFWDFSNTDWSAHRIGWAVAGGAAAITCIVACISISLHATNYQRPREQRQIMRIMMMPPIYAVISFFSYRYYREYTYYELVEVAYEGITIAAFLLLLVEYVSGTASRQDINLALARKDKQGLPMTFGKIRFRASKPYFIHTLKWSVLQYAIFRPLISIISLICEACHKLCPEQYSVYFAELYLASFDFVVISVALYGLFVFYELTKSELKGKQPLSKFMTIKMIVFFTFYQGFVFSVLQEYDVIKATKYWTATNVSDGLNALCTSLEMVIFSVWMAFAFPAKEYKGIDLRPRTFGNYLRAIRDAAILDDMAIEVWHSWMFFLDYMRGKPGTRYSDNNTFDHRLEKAFGAAPPDDYPLTSPSHSSIDVTANANGKEVDNANISRSPYATIASPNDPQAQRMFASDQSAAERGRQSPRERERSREQQAMLSSEASDPRRRDSVVEPNLAGVGAGGGHVGRGSYA